ncbi:cysteine desulfurase [archaeon]|jgi:cysteine desulfurase|nr:cysteine desulfurase [archaeon]MBT6823822.1 cysteine desulfurase [archaeon]MBT7107143.1 cysteine desulfurase [archaeon]MBT7297253.1 cysteine desulfurase [archaeon]
MRNKQIYLDNSATTPVDKKVIKEMSRYYSEDYGNAGSMHDLGLISDNVLDSSRAKVAKILNADSEEIIFTGSGTESINLALKGLARKLKSKGNHIISTTIEHPAVLNTLKSLKKEGFEISLVPVEKNGIISSDKIKSAIKKETIIISTIYANNELGTIQPIREIGSIAKNKKIIFHTDACQAANSEELDVKKLNVDLMSLNGSKIYGPKGTGCLYKNNTIQLDPILDGGNQEFGLRSGTENIPGIVGFTKALELAQNDKKKYSKTLTELRDHLITGLMQIDRTILNGDKKKRLPNNVNITFLNIEGESILLKLNEYKIYASTGSACSSRSLTASHVLLAIGQSEKAAHGSIRFSLGKYTKKSDINKVLKVLPKIVKELREMSPVHMELKDLK